MSTSQVPMAKALDHPAAGPAITHEKIYLYAIVLGAEARTYEWRGIDAQRVYAIVHGGLAAIVSPLQGGKVRPDRTRLAAHHELLKKLMTDTTPLPMAFGMVAKSHTAVRKLLARNQRTLIEGLRHVAGKVEMGLRVRWDVPNIFEYFVNVHPELRQARDRLVGVNSHPTQEHKIEVGSMFDHLLQEDRDSYIDQTTEALSERGFEVKPLKCRSELEVMTLACLVKREEMAGFESAVFEIAKQFDDNFALDYNGPWTPHNFVPLDLSL